MERRITKTRITTALLMLGLTLAGASQAASMYKWTDAEGNVHYSQTPPTSNQAEQMHIRDSKPGSSSTPTQAGDSENNIPDDAKQDPERAKIRTQNCEIARKNMNLYKQFSKIRQADGKVIELTDEMRAQKIEEAQKMIDKFCP